MRLIIFTTPAALNSVNVSFAKRGDIRALTENSPILKFSESDNSFAAATVIDIEGLYLVFDGIAKATLASLFKHEPNGHTFILKHQKPDFDLQEYEAVIEKGRHAANGAFYPDLVRILQDDEPEKIPRIREALFAADSDEITLELLHRCATQEGARKLSIDLEEGKVTEDLAKLASKPGIRDIVAVLANLAPVNANPVEFESSYIKSLTGLRDRLFR